MIRTFILIILLSVLASCDCYRGVSGTVIDNTTGRPISFAFVQIVGNKNNTTTDSLGRFNLNIINSGFQCYCKPKNKVTIASAFYFSDTFHLNQSVFKLQADTSHIRKFFDPRNDFMGKWSYFNLADTIELKVIHHIPATMKCEGGVETYSITIGTIQSGDTIRVLELCNASKDFNKGDKVLVIPGMKPEGYYIHPGVFVQGYVGPLRPSDDDTLVLKTTYGTLYKR